ncbi:MAG: hypothetical protein WA642_03235 [Steroidobacteraceae bacterium]
MYNIEYQTVGGAGEPGTASAALLVPTGLGANCTGARPIVLYAIADQQSKDMIDALTAARTALPLASLTLTKDGGQLFITGYSQGGYVAMATHRAMQAAGMTVTAAAPMSGPYALAAFVDAVFYGEVNGDAPVSSTLLLTAYQKAYGDILCQPGRRIREPVRAGHRLLAADHDAAEPTVFGGQAARIRPI